MKHWIEVTADHAAALRLLVEDLRVTCEYVEPVDDNLETYSHRLYELLLRASTELESMVRQLLIAADIAASEHLSMKDYVKLDAPYRLSSFTVDVMLWRPEPKRLVPFGPWKEGRPLGWYQSYNEVKHNRSGSFRRASLAAAIEAIAGVFVILARSGHLESDGAHWRRPGGMNDGRSGFVGIPFELIDPAPWLVGAQDASQGFQGA